MSYKQNKIEALDLLSEYFRRYIPGFEHLQGFDYEFDMLSGMEWAIPHFETYETEYGKVAERLGIPVDITADSCAAILIDMVKQIRL